jgi:class 3 adenylate cyclase/predicted ATPase
MSTFAEIRAQVLELLQQEGRVAYRVLKRQFALDDDYIEDLKADLIDAKRLAVDEDGKVLVWIGTARVAGATAQVAGATAANEQRVSSPHPLDVRPTAGERRQLTVQFIDLVGSTTLSQQLDPEDYHARVVAYQTACQRVITRYEGHIAQYLGDGVLVYFGYPAAHEEDVVRAVRSGMEIVTAVSQLAYTPPLQVRLGIHTGPVVMGEIGAGEHTERLALGETPNLAARIQGQAEPGTVVLSAATRRLVAGLFECEELGPHTLKGTPVPVSLYRVVQESQAQSRFEVAVRTGLTPLVGREEELELLRRRWERAQAGEGQVVLLTGEPGIGKSRLVQTIKEQAGAERATRIEFRCSPYHQNSAFYPIIDHLQRLLQFAPHDTPQAKLTTLQQTLSTYRFPQADTLPLLAALLSLPHPESAPLLTLSPQKQKQKTQEVLVAWIVEEAERVAVFCAWEDLHWADPSTLEVLTLFLDQVPTTRLLAVLTFRLEFTPPWQPRSHLTQLTLNRLGRPQVEAMVGKVTGGKALPPEVVQQIVAKTDGVPLFVEELAKMVLESGLLREADGHYELSGPLPPLAIPSTLQDSLMARLDRLATTREIAQLAAALGREFSYKLLQAVAPWDEAALQHGLRQLVEAELLYQRSLPPQATYLFKHALIQDAAYQSLLKSTRQQYHRQIAQVLEERFPETVESQPELVAHHYTEAALIAKALPYWQRAGERATQRSAYMEAISHLTKGLALLKTLPDTPERAQQELRLQIALGTPLLATKGWATSEVKHVYTQALELCQQVGGTPQLLTILVGLSAVCNVRGEQERARELGEQMLHLAQSMQHPLWLLVAHYSLGEFLYALGELHPARGHLEQGIALYDPHKGRSTRVFHGVQHPAVGCLSVLATVLWLLGYPDQALQRSQEALTLAQELSHPFSLGYALQWAAWFHLHRREGPTAQERAEAVMELSTEQGFPVWLALGTIERGGALAEQGQGEEGIAQMQQGMAACRAIGLELGWPYFLALLTEAYGKKGQAEEGLNMLAEGLATAHKTGERHYEAELYRLKGQLTLQQFQVQGPKTPVPRTRHLGPSPQAEAEAEACFQKAIEIARRQQAKSLELRAAMSLSRLWQQQGKQAEARLLLSEIYGWFTEGFDTKDLQEAKALLHELAEGSS